MRVFDKLATGVILGAMGLVMLACGGKSSGPKIPPSLVSAVTVHKQEVPITYEYAGRIVAFKKTEVRARVGGILLHRNFIEGSMVKQGDVLFEIDPAPYQAEVNRQKALVAQAQANYDQSVSDANRIETLVAQKVLSNAQRDMVVAKREANGATLKQMQAALQSAELNLAYTKVTAPISGMTSREAVSEGSLIGTDPTSSLLTTITQSDPIYVNFSYADTDAQAIRKLMADMNARGEKISAPKVRIRFGDGTAYDKLGTVDFTSPTLDTMTGTYGVRGVVANPNSVLVPGQFVRVTVEGLKLDQSIVIPEGSLMQDGAGMYVFVVQTVPAKDDSSKTMQIAVRRPVKVARQLANRDWLLVPVQTVETKPAPAAQDGQPPAQGAESQQNVTPPVSYIGLNDGDVVITEGQVRIQSGLAALGGKAAGVPVAVTTLDGRDLTPAKPDSKAEAAK